MMRRNIWPAFLTILLTACLLLSLALIGGALWVLRSNGNPGISPVQSATPVPPLPTMTIPPTRQLPTSVATPAPPLPTATAQYDPETLRVMQRLERETADLRQLPILTPVQRIFYSPEQLQERVKEDFLKDYTPEEMARDQQILALFGLLPPRFDLKALLSKLYTEQIAGFYDDETQEMVIVREGAFGGVERMTYVHEFVHALQDQHFHLRDPEGLNFTETLCDQDSERCAALQALVEGDATFTEYLWLFTTATERERKEIRDFYKDYTSPIFDSAPLYLQKDFLFPYDAGYNFVQALFGRGGWAAVNAAYRNPPTSTEQILHPERYPDDTPQTVTLPDLQAVLGEGWTLLQQDTLGEWSTYLLLSAGYEASTRLSEEEGQGAAAGWGGDAFAVFRRPQDGALALVVDWRWDSGNDRYEFAQAFIEYADTATLDALLQALLQTQ